MISGQLVEYPMVVMGVTMLTLVLLQDMQHLVRLPYMIILVLSMEGIQLEELVERYLLEGFLRRQLLKTFTVILVDLVAFWMFTFQRIPRDLGIVVLAL